LPKKVSELIKQGMELGEANDLLFNQQNSKQKGGSVGILTDDVIDRTEIYWPAVVMALIPFKNSDLF
jgi:non-canonical (house-cleaning) NTP pyrophosphatase